MLHGIRYFLGNAKQVKPTGLYGVAYALSACLTLLCIFTGRVQASLSFIPPFGFRIGRPVLSAASVGGLTVKNQISVTGGLLLFLLWPSPSAWAAAATTGTEFQAFYTFIEGAATGFLGRAVAITGGLIALGIAAATGRYVVAIGGIVLAIFGSLGPDIVNAIFGAVI